MATPEEQAQIAYRDQVNWRSVTRADPSVQQILNTCTFSSVFIFDKVADEWVKQKQEGPLFLVRRNKEPEYALYMLNRATIKNVLWPLIPNEMRVTPTVDDMLIVERRGEGIKTGIHFGEQVVEEFRSSIIGICGDPRAKSGSAPPTQPQSHAQPQPRSQPQPQSQPTTQPHPQSQSQAQPQSQPQQRTTAQSTSQPVDDLSRLFSGILSVPSSSSRPPSATNQPPSQSTGFPNGNNTQSHTSSVSTSRSGENTYTQTTQTTTTYTTNRPGTPPSPPITFSEIPVSPSKSPVNLHPPGQTVADLLNSIGGFSFPTPAPPPAQGHPLLSPSNHFSPPQAQAPAPAIPAHPLLSPSNNFPTAQPESPIPPPSAPSHPLLSSLPPPQLPPQVPRTPPPPPQASGPTPNSAAQRPRDRPPHLDAPPIPSGHPASSSGISAIQGAILSTLPATYQPSGPDHRGAFQRDLIDMLQRDPIFVDQLFQAYLARRS